MAITKQRILLGVSISRGYYKPKTNLEKKWIIDAILLIFERVPIYVPRKVHQALKEEGISVSVNTVSRYRKELKLEPILAVKVQNLSIPNQQHKKYSYKLRSIEIFRANQVWSAGIIYIRVVGTNVYLIGIIDWYSKTVL
ncbi:MAG: hypothetical protein NTX05_08515 [Fusobacteria bacterium]|nr:hypothetical protein [Fusobacteriota bacterium]